MTLPVHRLIGALLLLPVAPVPAAAQGAKCTPVPVAGPRTKPPYPLLSITNREQGTTELEVTVARDGHPSRVRLIKSSGFPRLDEMASTHVQQNFLWRPMTCASAKSGIRMVWNTRSRCTLTNTCKPSLH